MKGRDLPIIKQLQYDFPKTTFNYTDNHLVVNGIRVRTFLTPEEIARHEPVKAGSRSYYQLFCNIVYNQFHIAPRSGSYAELLIIDKEEERKAAIAKWFSEKRLAFIENGSEVTAVRFEIEGDTTPLGQIQYDIADEVEPIDPDESVEELEGMDDYPKRTPEEQLIWEREIQLLQREGEIIKKEMKRKKPEEKRVKKRFFNFFGRGT